MKKAFKRITLILLCAAAVFGCLALSACSKNGGDGTDDEDNYTRTEIEGNWDKRESVKVAFADEAAYNNGDIDGSKIVPNLNCKTGEKHFMIIDFDIQAQSDNSGRENLTAFVHIEPAAAVTAKIQETNSGNITEETVEDVTTLQATYKIPESAETVRERRLIVQLNTLLPSEAYVDITFESTGGVQAVKEKLSKTVMIEFTKGLTYGFVDGNYTVTGIGDNSIKQIVVPFMYNRYYVSDNCKGNCVLSSDGKTVIAGCAGSVIPDGVASIGDGAFRDCSGLTSITLPDGVTSIGDTSFHRCTGLMSLTLTDSVTFIGAHAFMYCSKLTSVTFIGNSAKWKTVSKGGPWWNYSTGNYTVYCTDGKLNKSGKEI